MSERQATGLDSSTTLTCSEVGQLVILMEYPYEKAVDNIVRMVKAKAKERSASHGAAWDILPLVTLEHVVKMKVERLIVGPQTRDVMSEDIIDAIAYLAKIYERLPRG